VLANAARRVELDPASIGPPLPPPSPSSVEQELVAMAGAEPEVRAFAAPQAGPEGSMPFDLEREPERPLSRPFFFDEEAPQAVPVSQGPQAPVAVFDLERETSVRAA